MARYGQKSKKSNKSSFRKHKSVSSTASSRNKPAKMANVEALAKSISRMKKQLRKDTEMKEYSPVDLLSGIAGQINVNNSGALVIPINNMNIPAGVGRSERVGEEARLKGIHFRFQIFGQTSVTFPSNMIIDVFKTHDFSASSAALRDQIYEVDSMSGVVDYHSTINKEVVGKDKLYQLISRKLVYFKADDFSGSQQQWKDLKFFVKQNQLVTYAGPSTQTPYNVRYFVIIRGSCGNVSSTVSTLPTVAVLSPSSGYVVRMKYTDYYTDN